MANRSVAQLLSPEELINRATAMGLGVQISGLEIFLFGDVKEGKDPKRAQRACLELGWGIPRAYGLLPGQGAEEIWSPLSGPPWDNFALGIEDVDPAFVRELAPLAEKYMEERKRLGIIDGRFDERVAEEVEKDPEVMALEARLAETRAQMEMDEAALQERKAALLREREPLRDTFHYVVGGREV